MTPLKKSEGNMYEWTTHTHSHLAGVCPHKCSYCYVQAMERRFGSGRYAGPLRLVGEELPVNYGKDRTIFIEHMNDLCAEAVPDGWIKAILAHTREYPDNCYVFQSKNPWRLAGFLEELPPQWMLGTTIETTQRLCNEAPDPELRAAAMARFRVWLPDATLFVTIEPIQEFDPAVLLMWLEAIQPTFVTIGADSKGHGLQEPSAQQILDLIAGIQALKIEIRKKTNLARLVDLA